MTLSFESHFDKLNKFSAIKHDPGIKSKKKENTCNNCQTKTIIKDYSSGYSLCKTCGEINDIIIDSTAEWRVYSDSNSKNSIRCGNPINPLLPMSSMGTCISGNKYGSIQRLHTWNAMPSHERSLWLVFESINRKTRNCNLAKKIIEESKYYYKMISTKEKDITGTLTRGSVREGLTAACCFIACKNNGVPRLASEIAEIFDISTTDVTKGLKKFVEIEKKKSLSINVNITDTDDFIARYCNKLNILEEKQKICFSICSRVKKLKLLNENTPPSVAASIIFLISNVYQLRITKEDICKTINISNVTITKGYKKLIQHKTILFLGLL